MNKTDVAKKTEDMKTENGAVEVKNEGNIDFMKTEETCENVKKETEVTFLKTEEKVQKLKKELPRADVMNVGHNNNIL